MDSTKGGPDTIGASGAGRHRRSGKGFGFGLLVALGTVLMVCGIVGLVYTGIATLTTMLLFGWLLLIGGVVGLVQAIQARKENAFWLVVAVSALNIAAGVVLLRRPEVAAAALTLFVALLLLGAGLFRIVGGVASMSAKMIWTIVVGVIDLVLGLLVLAEWPSSSRYAIGMFISLALLFDGLSLVSLGLTGRRIVGMVREAEVPEAAERPHDAAEWQADEEPPREGSTFKGPDAMTKKRDDEK
ncbi:HdeD family acid-resistance protein [Embleya sp. NBC_00896]|uniref:HdeD family acid-resistance protein n=1 Tax=Embleya sp. NBC_00896 TaxID=2975961 RepID=UPI00386F2738|nr:HdeD family acid-resistance protein [Embleya sp. NBC_00896]